MNDGLKIKFTDELQKVPHYQTLGFDKKLLSQMQKHVK